MFETMKAASEGTGRTQPINGLDELLSLPGKTAKAARQLPSRTGTTPGTPFTQMLTEGLLSLTTASGQTLPPGEANALPPVAGKSTIGLTAQLTAGDAPLPQSSGHKRATEKPENIPVAGEIGPGLIASLCMAVSSVPGTVPTTSESGNDTLLPGGASVPAAGILTASFPSSAVPTSPGEEGKPLPTATATQGGPAAPDAPPGEGLKQTSELTEVSSRKSNPLAPPLALAVAQETATVAVPQEGTSHGEATREREAICLTSLRITPEQQRKPEEGVSFGKSHPIASPSPLAIEQATNRPATLSATVTAGQETTAAAMPQEGKSHGEAKQVREAGRLASLQITPEQQRKPEEGVSFGMSHPIAPPSPLAIEQATNRPATLSATVTAGQETTAAAMPQEGTSHGEAKQVREAGRLASLQITPEQQRKPEEGVPFGKSHPIAPPSPLAIEQATNRPAALSAMVTAGQGTTTAAMPQEGTSHGGAKQEREAGRLASPQIMPEQQKKPEEGVSFGKNHPIAPPSPLAVEQATNRPAALPAATTAGQEKITLAAQQTGKPYGEANSAWEAALPKNIRESVAKTALDEFMAPKGDVKKDYVMGEKGKLPRQSLSTVPEITDMSVNTAGAPLTKIPETTEPATSLLAQVAEQLPPAISKGSGRIRLSLKPENLGKLDMDLVVRENRVQIVLTAENRTVQQTLQGHGEQLKDALQQQGLEVDGFTVLQQNNRQGQGDPSGGSNPFWGEYRQAAGNQKDTGSDHRPAAIAPFVSGKNPHRGTEGVNIFI